MKIKISAALATHNEESNLEDCLQSIQGLVDEIIIVDGESEDKTVEIARKFGAKITIIPNDPMFHNMKQKSFDLATGDWILYLDADERVSPKLAKEIREVVEMHDDKRSEYVKSVFESHPLLLRHHQLLEKRDGHIGKKAGPFIAFFFPRLNYFLGKYLRYGGVYPDGVIRLFKRGKAILPCRDLHEQMEVYGRVGWLKNDLLHLSDPTFRRYLERNNRYINRITEELKIKNESRGLISLINYMLIKPLWWFLKTQFRHKGILDGFPGLIFSFFSALRFPRAYWRYLNNS